MNINSTSQNLSFSRIDNPVEAFITPPNDPLAGLLMDRINPKDKIEITGSIGDKEFSYLYSFKNNKITMTGQFESLPFEAQGVFQQSVSIEGHIGENNIASAIEPQNNGPFTRSQAGLMDVKEKVNFDINTGEININGTVGSEILEEKIFGDGTKIFDRGNIGKAEIFREVVRNDKGYFIKGTIDGLIFKEEISF